MTKTAGNSGAPSASGAPNPCGPCAVGEGAAGDYVARPWRDSSLTVAPNATGLAAGSIAAHQTGAERMGCLTAPGPAYIARRRPLAHRVHRPSQGADPRLALQHPLADQGRCLGEAARPIRANAPRAALDLQRSFRQRCMPVQGGF